ncbi:hypothetical protein Tdes44962_MAKER08215 [Teratosphaeria destructans]|uniref:Uncharacterized protein n=1 Tax=Teratosphaeria destructans TaxID=418781 RepID=A0A9W7SXK6_9PEZI|nr:hypothetical protein Tdes44962_MAKER08215 [Teratosphaeria destructans]
MGFIRATFATLVAGASAHISIPAVDGSLPAPESNGCAAGFWRGNHTLLYTVPYSYDQVLSIIGDFVNLTWSGSPDHSVQTNNTDALVTNDWTPGSARFYDFAGAHFIETITQYQKPHSGPYIQVHTVAPLQVPSFSNVQLYSDYDAQHWVPVCDGRATAANFTINFCATNVAVGSAFLEKMHSMAATRVGQLLGGQQFSNCEALGVRSYLKRTVSNISGSVSTGPVMPGTVAPDTVIPATSTSAVNTVISATQTSMPTMTISASSGAATSGSSTTATGAKATYTGSAERCAFQTGQSTIIAIVALIAGGLSLWV